MGQAQQIPVAEEMHSQKEKENVFVVSVCPFRAALLSHLPKETNHICFLKTGTVLLTRAWNIYFSSIFNLFK